MNLIFYKCLNKNIFHTKYIRAMNLIFYKCLNKNIFCYDLKNLNFNNFVDK